jgi:Na+-transporting NADH:ubiquinone oxidoreductase subunit NqrD
MLAAGLAIGLIFRFASRFSSARDYAGKALRFQSIALGICVALVAVCAIPLVFGSGRNFTMEHPPAGIFAAVFLTGLAFGIVLPLIELVRAIVLGVRAFRRTTL